MQIRKFDDLFNLSFFKEQPEIFYNVCNEVLKQSRDKPSYTHHFIRMMYEQGNVAHYLTQNFDGLDEMAGFKTDEINMPKGKNCGVYCTQCQERPDRSEVIASVKANKVYYCKSCKGPVKMRMQFSGEEVNEAIPALIKEIAEECDLLIIIGLSFVNGPSLQLIEHSNCPKVLVSKTNPAGVNLDFETPQYPDRLLWKSSNDDFAKEIAEYLGLIDNMDERIRKAGGL